MANIVASVSQPSINVTSTPANITITDVDSNVIVSNIDNAVATITVDSTVNTINVSQTATVANSDVRLALSSNNTGGFGNISYSNVTGVITYTGVSNSDIISVIDDNPGNIRTAISNTLPITYNSSTGVIGFDANLDDLTLKKYQETVVDNGTTSGNISANISDGTIHKFTISGNVTGITLSNISSGGSATLFLVQDGTGGHILDTTTHSGNFTDWNFINDFTDLDLTATEYNILNVIYDGSKYYASLVTQDSPSIDNSDLANSNIIVNGTTISLGGQGNISNLVGLDTDNLAEGSANLYYTNARARGALSTNTVTPSGNGSLSYDNGTGLFTFTPADVPDNTDELSEGATNLYFTTARSNSAVVAYFGDASNGPFSINGNLDVAGNLNYENVVDLYVANTEIVMNANAATDSNVTITVNRPVAGSNAHLRWNENADYWEIFDGGNTFIIPRSTSDLAEGTNLYYTTDRANTAIDNYTGAFANAVINTTNDITTTGTITSEIFSTDENGKIRQGNISASNNPFNLSFVPGNHSQYLINDEASDAFGWYWTKGIELYSDTDDKGARLTYARGRGSIASPGGPVHGDRVLDEFFTHYANTQYPSTSSRIGSAGRWVFYDENVATYSDTVMPLTQEFFTYENGNVASDGNIKSIMRLKADRTVEIGADNTLQNATEAAIKLHANGVVSANGNIVTTANLNSAGGTLTGVLTSNSNIIISDAFFEGDLNGAVTIDVNNNTGAQLDKGKAVYLTGGNSGDNPNVALADADDATKMPAIGIVRENISDGSIGQVVTSGAMNFASHGFALGSDLFIDTTAGGLTVTKPTGEANLIQKIGKVISTNHIMVQGAFRTNDTPNLNNGSIFVGNTSNAVETIALNNMTQDITTSGYITAGRFLTAENGKIYQGNTSASNGPISSFTAGNMSRYYINDKSTDNFGWNYFNGAEVYADDDEGVMQLFTKGRGSIGSPAGPNDGDRIMDEFFMHYANTTIPDLNNIGQAGRWAFYDQDVASYNDTTMPITQEFFTYRNGDLSSGSPSSILRLGADRVIHFNSDATLEDKTTSNANIAEDGAFQTGSSITASGNITTTANVSGNYILGNGSQLSGIAATASNAFSTVVVSGQSNVVAGSSEDFVELEGSGAITITTDAGNNKVTIGGAASSYGDSNVTTLLSGGTLEHARFLSNSKIQQGNTGDTNAPINAFVANNSAQWYLNDSDTETFGDIYYTGAEVYASQTEGITEVYAKGRGNISSPAVISDGDRIYEEHFVGYGDGNYVDWNNQGTAGRFAYGDNSIGSGISNVTLPIVQEFWAYEDGGFASAPSSLMKIRPDKKIDFFANVVGPTADGGVANISSDGTIQTAQNVSVGNTLLISSLEHSSGQNNNIDLRANIVGTSFTQAGSNTFTNVQDVQAFDNGTLTEDSITFSGGQIFADGTAVTYANASNGDVTPLNSRVFFLKFNSGDGGRYELFDDSGFSTGSRRVTNSVFTSSGVGDVESATTVDRYNQIDISQGNISAGNATFSGASFLAENAEMKSNTLILQNTSSNITSLFHFQIATEDRDTEAFQLNADDNDGVHKNYLKARGNLSTPATVQGGDRVIESEYYAHDGTDFVTTFGDHVYVDTDVASVATNVVPMCYEIFTKPGGDVNGGFVQSLIKARADRTIIFNDTGTRLFGDGQGKARINADGNIHSNGSIFTNTIDANTGSTTTFASVPVMPSYSNTSLPTAVAGGYIYVTNGNNKPAYSNGSNWFYFDDNTQVT